MDERAEDWRSHWDGASCFAFVEQRERDQGVRDAETRVLDIVREDDVASFLREPNTAQRSEALHCGTAQLVLTLPRDRRRADEASIEGQWHRVRVGQRERHPAVLYHDLDGRDSTKTRVSLGGRVGSQTSRALGNLVSLDDAPTATNAEVHAMLAIPRSAFVAVYDVGQGNCNAVCNGQGIPLLYFDLGAGCLQNSHTRPPRLEYCFSSNPNVVLSHWDFDHWYGGWFSRAEAIAKPIWLAPRQKIGLRTLKFAAKLHSENRLRLWPDTLANAAAKFVEIVRCAGKTKNDSGVALAARVGRGGRSVLCPGDAAFDTLPVSSSIIAGRPLGGLVATHHGSGHIGMPVPRPSSRGVLAFSFGIKNSYGHPSAYSRSFYLGEKWLKQLDTPSGGVALGGRSRPSPCHASQCTLCTSQH